MKSYTCSICGNEKVVCNEEGKNFKILFPYGWKRIEYTDGDTFYFCELHSVVEVLNSMIARSDIWREVSDANL